MLLVGATKASVIRRFDVVDALYARLCSSRPNDVAGSILLVP